MPACDRTVTDPTRRLASALSAIFLLLAGCTGDLPAPTVGPAPQRVEDVYLPEPDGYRPVAWIDGLEAPWSLVFLPDGRTLVSERPGRIRLIRDGRLEPEPYAILDAAVGDEGDLVAGALDVLVGGEGGVLGLAIPPGFPDPPLVYVMQTYIAEEGGRNRVLRLRDQGGHGEVEDVILDGIPGWVFHNGGRIGFGPDGMLYVATGETFEGPLAQDLDSLGGKILRVTPEGEVPADNPFPGSPVFSYGHRNPQGLAWHPESGALFASEHGPTGEFGLWAQDEINVIVAGGNYGWPRVVGAPGRPDTVDPLITWMEDPVPPAGMAFHDGALWLATLASEALLRIELGPAGEAYRVRRIERWFATGPDSGSLGRLRDVVAGPDGHLYVLTSNRDGRGSPRPGDDRIYRLERRD